MDGSSHYGKRGLGSGKVKVVVVESEPENGKTLYIWMKVVQNVKGNTLQQFINKFLLAKLSRNVMDASAIVAWRAQNCTASNCVHTVIGKFKEYLLRLNQERFVHLHRHLDEFCSQFN